MKLRAQILLLVIVPLLTLGIITYGISYYKITETMTETIERGLNSTAIAVKDAISLGEGDFYIDDDGEMYKGEDINISQSTHLADDVKKETGMEVTVFFGDTRYMTSVLDANGERAIGTKAADKVVESVLNKGETYFAQRVDVAGEEFFAYYIPIYNDDSNTPVGMVFTGMSQEDAEAEIGNIVNLLLLIILITIVVCVIVAWVLANRIVNGVKMGVSALGEIADGNLTVEIREKATKRRDEIGDILSAVLKLRNQLVMLIGQISDKSMKVHEEAELLIKKTENTSEMVVQVEKAVVEIATGATSQAEETQDATEHIMLMGDMVEETTNEVNGLSQNSNNIKDAGELATTTLQELKDINSKVTEAIDTIYTQTNTTNESALKIQEATNLIASIAEETNLLSLNATIEAARAGEQGRGFAVVASQIQKLAEQSNKSASQIDIIIKSLINDSESAVVTMNEIQDIMKNQNQKVSQTDSSFEEVNSGIAESIVGIKAIQQQTKRLDDARVKVIDGVQNLSAIAEENAASTEETSAAVTEVSTIVYEIAKEAGELEVISDELKKSIELFRL